MNILVSRCLLGEPCRYDGKSKPCDGLRRLAREGHNLIAVCPECDGGLPTPRPPAEVQRDRRVINWEGRDVTEEYRSGAQTALNTALEQGCHVAVLKANSPSCGCHQIYDGSFQRRLIPGEGITAELLREHGIRVLDEQELELIPDG